MVFTVERWSFAAGSPASLIPQTCSRLVRFKMHACMQARIDGWMMQGRMEPYLRASAQSCAQSGIFCGAKQWCNDAVSLNTNQSYAKQCNTYGCTEYALVYVCVCPEHHIALSLHHPCDSMHAPAVWERMVSWLLSRSQEVDVHRLWCDFVCIRELLSSRFGSRGNDGEAMDEENSSLIHRWLMMIDVH